MDILIAKHNNFSKEIENDNFMEIQNVDSDYIYEWEGEL